MAIIKCPECGTDISDKAKKCIHCGKNFVEEVEPAKEKMKCLECGATLSEIDEFCPECGCPVEKHTIESEVKPQQVEVASIKMAKKTKIIVIGIISFILICAVGGIGYKTYSDKRAEQEYQISYNEYITNLEKVRTLMLSSGSDAESLCNLTLKVWGNAIYKEKSSETDKYTRPKGYFVDDFNLALVSLFADSKTTTTVSDIERDQILVKESIKMLQNPPEGLDKCYDTVSDLYNAYKTLTDLAKSPSGNYSGYGEDKSDAVSDFMSAYEKLDNQIPEKMN